MRTIRRLKVEVYPEEGLGGVLILKWRVDDGTQELAYNQTLWPTEKVQRDDFKSHWDYIWEKAKYEIEKAADKPPLAVSPTENK